MTGVVLMWRLTMTRCRLTTVIIATAAMCILWTSTVSADCDTQRRAPRTSDEALGRAFIGRFLGDASGPYPREHRWDVERVVRGAVGKGTVSNMTIGCHGVVGFVEGRRYLVSSSNLAEPNAGTLVAWEIRADDVRLLAFELPRDAYPDVWQVDTLSEALALVGRGDLPPTDVERPTGLFATGEFAMVATALASLAFVVRRWRLRST